MVFPLSVRVISFCVGVGCVGGGSVSPETFLHSDTPKDCCCPLVLPASFRVRPLPLPSPSLPSSSWLLLPVVMEDIYSTRKGKVRTQWHDSIDLGSQWATTSCDSLSC